MKLVTFNCNFNKGGIAMVQDILDGDADIICVQRFDIRDADRLRFRDRHWHFHTSFPEQLDNGFFGLLTVWSSWIAGTAAGIDLSVQTRWADRHQGNSMVRLDMENHSVINCLVGYPEDESTDDVETWLGQVQQAMLEAMDGRSILVGDFHYDDSDPMWLGINRGLLDNKAAMLNSFRNQRGRLVSLTKIFAGPKVLVHNVEPAIKPYGHNSWTLNGMHWPVAMEYLP